MKTQNYSFTEAEAAIIKKALEEYLNQHVLSNEHEYSRRHIENALNEIEHVEDVNNSKKALKALEAQENRLMKEIVMKQRNRDAWRDRQAAANGII